MTIEFKESIERAVNMAGQHGIPKVEVWVGPKAFKGMEEALGVDPDVTAMGNKLFFRGMRLRIMQDEGVRVGETTCEWGPGKT